jgi:Protein of unknown function (DUF3093)
VTEPAPRQGIDADAGGEYRERLRTPWWWYPIGIVVGVLLGAEFDFVMPPSLVGLPVVVSVLIAIVVVWRLSSSTVRVRGGRVVIGTRSLPVADIERTFGLRATELRRLVGRHGDPLAFVFIRPWIGPGVQLVLAKPAGEPKPHNPLPEPYWVLSSRHPDRFLAAIEAARAVAR